MALHDASAETGVVVECLTDSPSSGSPRTETESKKKRKRGHSKRKGRGHILGRIGTSSRFCYCLNLKMGFQIISILGVLTGISLLCSSQPIWRVFRAGGTAMRITHFIQRHFASQLHRVTEKTANFDPIVQLLSDSERWCWWIVWFSGILWTLQGCFGLWSEFGCLGAKDRHQIRRGTLIFITTFLLLLLWLYGVALSISLPIWFRVARGINMFSVWGWILYSVIVLIFPFFLGFRTTQTSASYYRVVRVGGTGKEFRSYEEVIKLKRKQKTEEEQGLIYSSTRGQREDEEDVDDEDGQPLLLVNSMEELTPGGGKSSP